LLNQFLLFCEDNDLVLNVDKTKAMFVNCDGILKVYNEEIKTVKSFRYLGLEIANDSTKPDKLLIDRL
jgi:hypothetical protein